MKAQLPGTLRLFTIGVYGSNEAEFFDRIVEHKIDVFVDIRARRGVRGAEYRFVNSTYLQERLAELGIEYHHALELATPDALRAQQYEADKYSGVGQRSREALAPEFVAQFKRTVLRAANLKRIVEFIEERRAQGGPLAICLCCVEAKPEACHRSLVADALGQKFSVKPRHL
ncbi:DUF488 domain-containing protein [candidate division KSB1 bacterium]|nr:DUF488 domain-containing protein [candidate division KSB1 bacterium]